MEPLFLNISTIKGVATLRTELRRIRRILRLPSTFITLILRNSCWFRFSALGTESPFIPGAAGAGPETVCCWFRFPAFGAELSFISRSAAGAGPTIGCCRGRLPILSLLSHGKQILRIHSACIDSHIHPCERHHRSGAGIGRRRLHRLGLSIYQVSRRHIRIAQSRILLQFLNHLLIFFRCLYGTDSHSADGNSIFPSPIIRKNLI